MLPAETDQFVAGPRPAEHSEVGWVLPRQARAAQLAVPRLRCRALALVRPGSFIDQADWGGYLACAAIVNTLDAALTQDPEEPELRTCAEKHLARIAQREPEMAARWRRVLELR